MLRCERLGRFFRLRYPLAGCLSVAVTSFLAAQEPPPSDLTITEVWSSEAHEWADGLSFVQGLGETLEGTLWVSDAFPGRILVVDSGSGRMIGVRGQGEGPGEVDSPGMIGITPAGHVAVYDMGRVSIDIFSLSGDFARRVRLPVRVEWPKGFAVLPSGDFVISGPVPGIDHAIHQFDQNGKLIRSWGGTAEALDRQAAMIGTGGALQASSDGSLLYSQGAPHRIVRYVPADDLPTGSGYWREHVVAEMAEMFDAPGDAIIVNTVEDGVPYRGFNVTYPQSRAVFEMGGGLILNVVVMRDEARSVWQLFSETEVRGADSVSASAPLAEAHVGEAYVPWFKSSNGDILAHRLDPATDVPVVVRLRVDRGR